MTHQERFEALVAAMVKVHTAQCWCAGSPHPGKCYACGPEQATLKFLAGCKGALLEDPPPCTVCDQSGVCKACGGTQIIVPHPHSYPVATAVLGSAILSIRMARDDEQFEAMNEMIDVAAHWIASAESSEEDVEMASRLIDAISNPDPKPPDTSSALTEDELRDLGIE